MRDANVSSFHLLAGQADWTVSRGIAWDGAAHLAGKQKWLLPAPKTGAAARAVLAASVPVVLDGFGAIARIAGSGLTIESLDGTSWVPLTDLNGAALAPKTGKFVGMALGGARLALLAGDGTHSFLQLFDLRGRWGIDEPDNPAAPLTLDPAGTAV